MRIDLFDPPGNIDDFGNDADLKRAWSDEMSGFFDTGVASVTQFLQNRGGGTCQFYNPVTHGRPNPDLAPSLGDIPWNGFPKRFGASGTTPANFAAAEPRRNAGQARLQDEYLEWHVNRNAAGKITSIHFTCEAWDYFEFLGEHAPDKVVSLYKTFIAPPVTDAQLRADLFANGTYKKLNKWNTALGAMHLTHGANNLFAEVFLAASATVRRRKPNGSEHTQSIPLIQCAVYGDASRNSDPNIGIKVNDFARQKRMITLANPVGLYMADFNDDGITLNGNPAGGFFRVVRGAFPRALRAVFELPPAEAAAGLTVSDVKIGARPIQFGGQLAERITMHLFGIASVDQPANNAPVGCGAVPQADPQSEDAAAEALTFNDAGPDTAPPRRKLIPRK